jgi:anti-sigma regulatory factor (Ser/Thr protein kinase)
MTASVNEIEVSGPAYAETVGLLRAVAATLAARLGMDVVEIEELRIVVDEASTLLLTAGSAQRIWMSISMPDGDRLAIRVRTDARIEALEVDDRTSWPWRVIRQLTTDAHAGVDGDGPSVSFLVQRGGQL